MTRPFTLRQVVLFCVLSHGPSLGLLCVGCVGVAPVDIGCCCDPNRPFLRALARPLRISPFFSLLRALHACHSCGSRGFPGWSIFCPPPLPLPGIIGGRPVRVYRWDYHRHLPLFSFGPFYRDFVNLSTIMGLFCVSKWKRGSCFAAGRWLWSWPAAGLCR